MLSAARGARWRPGFAGRSEARTQGTHGGGLRGKLEQRLDQLGVDLREELAVIPSNGEQGLVVVPADVAKRHTLVDAALNDDGVDGRGRLSHARDRTIPSSRSDVPMRGFKASCAAALCSRAWPS
jgi:hypothetical protein